MFLKIKFYAHNFKMLHTFISPVHMHGCYMMKYMKGDAFALA